MKTININLMIVLHCNFIRSLINIKVTYGAFLLPPGISSSHGNSGNI